GWRRGSADQRDKLFHRGQIEPFSSAVPRGANRLSAAWSYSILILRGVVAGRVQTQFVAGEVYQKPDESVAPNVYQVTAVVDLNGDGKLEVIVHSFYYEGGQTTIYRCEPDKTEEVLSVECGA